MFSQDYIYTLSPHWFYKDTEANGLAFFNWHLINHPEQMQMFSSCYLVNSCPCHKVVRQSTFVVAHVLPGTMARLSAKLLTSFTKRGKAETMARPALTRTTGLRTATTFRVGFTALGNPAEASASVGRSAAPRSGGGGKLRESPAPFPPAPPRTRRPGKRSPARRSARRPPQRRRPRELRGQPRPPPGASCCRPGSGCFLLLPRERWAAGAERGGAATAGREVASGCVAPAGGALGHGLARGGRGGSAGSRRGTLGCRGGFANTLRRMSPPPPLRPSTAGRPAGAAPEGLAGRPSRGAASRRGGLGFPRPVCGETETDRRHLVCFTWNVLCGETDKHRSMNPIYRNGMKAFRTIQKPRKGLHRFLTGLWTH